MSRTDGTATHTHRRTKAEKKVLLRFMCIASSLCVAAALVHPTDTERCTSRTASRIYGMATHTYTHSTRLLIKDKSSFV